jgi:arylsulfatase A-like enzyme
MLSACSNNETYPDSNVILIVIDAMRNDRLNAFDDDKAICPFINKLADECVSFRHAISPSSWTKPSVASLMTSLYPGQHRALSVSGRIELDNGVSYLDPEHVTLAERLKNAGYRTAAFVKNINISSSNRFDQGFNEFTSQAGHAQELISKASKWIEEHGKEDKFFLYLHLIDPHSPYHPPMHYRKKAEMHDPGAGATLTRMGLGYEIDWGLLSIDSGQTGSDGNPLNFDPDNVDMDMVRQFLTESNFWKQGEGQDIDEFSDLVFYDFDGRDDPRLLNRIDHLAALYDGEVTYANDFLFYFYADLKKEELLDNTILIVTSDHGEAFFEHGVGGHRKTVMNEEISIPLIMRIPQADGKPLRRAFDEYVSLVDIYPTILDMLGMPVPASLFGTSLWPAIRENDAASLSMRPIFSELFLGDSYSICTLKEGKKLIYSAEAEESGAWQFYDLITDPGELEPAEPMEADPEIQNMMRSIEDFIENEHREIENKEPVRSLAEEELDELKRLGYL